MVGKTSHVRQGPAAHVCQSVIQPRTLKNTNSIWRNLPHVPRRSDIIFSFRYAGVQRYRYAWVYQHFAIDAYCEEATERKSDAYFKFEGGFLHIQR